MRVAVLMGGRSGEHEVSLRSGAAVIGALEALEWDALALTFSKSGKAGGGGAKWETDCESGEGAIIDALAALVAWRPDCAFIAMHGPDGEDGRIQGALETLGIRYQGSAVQASAIGLDKIRTKEVLRAHGLPVAAERVTDIGATVDWDRLAAEVGLPLVLKTPASGSSVGVEVVRDLGALRARGDALHREAGRVLAEAFVTGREVTLPVVETINGAAEAFPVVEIRPRSAAFFDYDAKYTPGATDEICPAPIPPELEAELRTLGVAAHRALGCRGYSRTDCIITPEGKPVLLEVNTLPGLTRESLLPKSAAVHGLTFPMLIERLVRNAVR